MPGSLLGSLVHLTVHLMNVRYHLWLKPSREASDQFADVIRQLALDLNTPIFEPHITLLGMCMDQKRNTWPGQKSWLGASHRFRSR